MTKRPESRRMHISYRRKLAASLLVAAGVVFGGCSTTSTSSQGEAGAAEIAAQGGTQNKDAIREFEEAVKLYASVSGGELGEVVKRLEDAVDEDPGFGKAWFNLGLVYQEQGRAEEARAAYERAAETAPSLGAPWVNLGMLELEQGNRGEARRLFERAIEVEPFSPAAHNNVSVFYREDEDFARAVSHARRSLAGDSQNVDAYANLARIYYARGNYDVAKLVILNALKLEEAEPNADLHNVLGLVELARNDVTAAIGEFDVAIGIDAKHVPARMNLGAVMLNVQSYLKAIEHFEVVLGQQPDNVEAKLSVAVAKRGLEDLEAAQQTYAEVLALEPRNARVQFNLGVLEHEHLAQDAMIGSLREDAAPTDPVAQMGWTIENMERAISHYEKAMEHYRNFLAYDESGDPERRKEANERITQVAEVMAVTREQIPMLEEQREELRAQLAEQMEAQEPVEAQEPGEQESVGESGESAGEI